MQKSSLILTFVLLLCAPRFAPCSIQTRQVPIPPESVHLIYSYSAINHKWPETVRQQLIIETKDKIESLSKQPDGDRYIASAKGHLALYESRGKNAFETGRCSYWGTRNGWIWDNGKFAWAYNGKVIITSVAKNILSDPIPSNQQQPILQVKTNKADVDIVPYLGFQQPAKQLRSTKNHSLKKMEDGWEETSYVPDLNILGDSKETVYAKVLLHYDKQDRLKSVSKFVGKKLTILDSCTTFSDYSSIPGGFVCPHTVVEKNYRSYSNKGVWRSYLSWTHTYKLIKADTKHLDDAMFSVQHPPLDSNIQDFRYKNEKNPGGVMYVYSNPNLTMDQASLAAAKADAERYKTQHAGDWGLMAVRYVSFGLVAVLLANPVVRLIRKNRMQGKK